MFKFPSLDVTAQLGITPICMVSDFEIWTHLVTPTVKGLLGPIVSQAAPELLDSIDGKFPGDEVSNQNDHRLYGGKTGFVRFPYLYSFYKTVNGAFIVKRDGVKFEAFCWYGDIERSPELILKAALRDRANFTLLHCRYETSVKTYCRRRLDEADADDATQHIFLQAFSKIGLVPDTGGTWFLPQRVGMARAMGLALLADKLPAEKAADWGLIWAAYDDAEFAAKVDAMAAQLAAMPTKALVRTRQAMHAAPGHTLEQQLSFEGGFMRELGWSPDYAEGVAAFMEKRAPKFTGE